MADQPDNTPHGGAARSGVSRRSFLKRSVSTGVAAAGTVAGQGDAAAQAATATGDTVDVRLKINGADHALTVDPRVTVLDLLREELNLTGTKVGCNHGQCGACTVLMNGTRVNSCLMLVAMADGASIVTIEGLVRDDDKLHPMQRAFIEHDGFQCGYCTPGQIVSAVGCVKEGHANSPAEIREYMSGNLCRCGAYKGILEAVESARDETAALPIGGESA